MSKHTPTKEQRDIIEAAVTSNKDLIISAYAGCAKTSTLEMLANALPPIKGKAMALAFNTKIATELSTRLPSWFEVCTFNALGHRVWKNKIRKPLRVEEHKLRAIVKKAFLKAGIFYEFNIAKEACALVQSALTVGLVPRHHGTGLILDTLPNWLTLNSDVELTTEIVTVAQALLDISIEASKSGYISFNDQIYMSVLFEGEYPNIDLLLVDEAQDLSPLNHLQISKMVGNTGRLIVCGDQKQAIYAFRGADSRSMENLRRLRTTWIDLPLTKTWRCPRVVVETQLDHAPGFTAAETNLEGNIVRFIDRWNWQDVIKVSQIEPTTKSLAFICRNNAPLVNLAFKLSKENINTVILGRDICNELLTIISKTAPDRRISKVDFVSNLKLFRSSEVQRLNALRSFGKASIIKDHCECLISLLEDEDIYDADKLSSIIKNIFDQDKGLAILSTGHKVKGLEYDCVVHIDPWRIPNELAKTEIELQQEANLKYVITTRTRNTLILANLENYRGSR